MKKNSFLINISRGEIVDETDLFHALKNNLISGAAVDVYSEEPYNGDLIKLNNIILTPHIGSYAQEGKLKMEVDAVNNLLKSLEKEL
jgi:D-3-phosphoglycerate dehydrogenase